MLLTAGLLALSLAAGLPVAVGAAAARDAVRRPGVVGSAASLRRLHIRLDVSYRVVGDVTRIPDIGLTGLPKHWRVVVRCLGTGCFSPGLHHGWRKDLRVIRKRTFYAGQRLEFVFRARGYRAVRFVLKMIDNGRPRLTVLGSKRRRHHGVGLRLVTHPAPITARVSSSR